MGFDSDDGDPSHTKTVACTSHGALLQEVSSQCLWRFQGEVTVARPCGEMHAWGECLQG